VRNLFIELIKSESCVVARSVALGLNEAKRADADDDESDKSSPFSFPTHTHTQKKALP